MDAKKVCRSWNGGNTSDDAPALTERQQSLVAESAEFIERYYLDDDGKQAKFNFALIEQQLGLEDGTLRPLMAKMRIHAVNGAGCAQADLTIAFLLGMWAMDTKYQHLETKTILPAAGEATQAASR